MYVWSEHCAACLCCCPTEIWAPQISLNIFCSFFFVLASITWTLWEPTKLIYLTFLLLWAGGIAGEQA